MLTPVLQNCLNFKTGLRGGWLHYSGDYAEIGLVFAEPSALFAKLKRIFAELSPRDKKTASPQTGPTVLQHYDFIVLFSSTCCCIRNRSRSRIGFRYLPVYDSETSATFSGVPVATIVPPLSPPSGPRSIM